MEKLTTLDTCHLTILTLVTSREIAIGATLLATDLRHTVSINGHVSINGLVWLYWSRACFPNATINSNRVSASGSAANKLASIAIPY
jgi:hypothetical protein